MDDEITEISGVRYSRREDSKPPYEIWAETGIRNKDNNDHPQYPWTVVDRRGVICLVAVDYPGRNFTTKAVAQQLCEEWND